MKAKPVFLDFLNREASRSIDRERHEALDLDILRILVLGLPHGFSANISQLTEYGNTRPKLFRVIMKLIEAGIIDATSNAATMNDFISDRQERYSHVPDRYRFYFAEVKELDNIKLGSRNDFSMTDDLSSHITDYESNRFQFDLVRAHKNDQSEYEAGHNALVSKIMKRDELAITRDLLEMPLGDQTMTPKQINASSRIISAYYMKIYAERRGLATCTGIPDFSFEDLNEGFPSFDYPILKTTLNALGGHELISNILFEEIISNYKTSKHLHFAYYLEAFLEACCDMISHKVNDPNSLPSKRVLLTQFLNKELTATIKYNSNNLNEFFEQAAVTLLSSGDKLAKSDMLFLAKWRKYVPEQIKGLVVITTATDSEDTALFKALHESGFVRSRPLNTSNGYAREYIRNFTQKIVHLRTSAGSMGINSAGSILPIALNTLDAKFVISAGICFGLKPRKHDEDGSKNFKQNYGDVLISTNVEDYETIRDGKDKIKRGQRLPVSEGLLQATRMAKNDTDQSDYAIYEGTMLSGQKLIDNEKTILELRSEYPDAIGGEMEGNAVATSCSAAGRQWIIIKGICDWGMDKEDGWQDTAANRAFQLAVKSAIILLTSED